MNQKKREYRQFAHTPRYDLNDRYLRFTLKPTATEVG